MTNGVLSCLTVVEVDSGIAGAVAGAILADYGAEVVKLEGAKGDRSRRNAGSRGWNRGKSSRVVADDPAAAQSLLARADVVLVSGGEHAEPLGLRLHDLPEVNPRAIIVRVTPYSGPTPWAAELESNSLLAAHMGLAARQASFSGAPIDPVNPSLLYVQGTLVSITTIAALIERESSQVGQVVVVPATQAVTHAAAGILSVDPALPDPPSSVGPGGRHPGYTRYRAKDGNWIVSGAVGPKFELALIDLLGLGEMFNGERLRGDLSQLIALENIEFVRPRMEAAFAERSRDEWLELLPSRGIPAGPVNARETWMDHPQVAANGLRVDLPVDGGVESVIGPLVDLSASPAHLRHAAPDVGDGEFTTPQSVETTLPERPPLRPGPLAGFRFLDVATFVAAPYGGTVLAALGAEVVKVEPPSGDLFRKSAFVYNRGLRCVALDLKSDRGADVFRRLASTADVVISGLRPGTEEALGIDHASLAALRPDMISVVLSGFGDNGPLAGRSAVDLVLQGVSGMMAGQGGDDEPVVNTSPIVDVTGSLLIALGSVLALLHRTRTGEGQHASTSLLAAATLLQWGELTRTPGGELPIRGARDFQGPGHFNHFYRCTDGWLRVDIVDDAPSAASVMGAGWHIDSGAFAADPVAELSRLCAEVSVATGVTRFQAAGLAAVRVRYVSEVVRDPHLLSNGLIHLRSSDSGGAFVTGGVYARFSRTHLAEVLKSPGAGEHTEQYLCELGYSPDEISSMQETGDVLLGAPMVQELPPVYR